MKPRICAIVGPRGDGTEPARLADEMVTGVLEALWLTPHRIDPEELALAGGTACQHFVLADEALIDAGSLSGLVWYHLGVREMVRPNSTVVLARAGDHVPSLPAQLRIVFYEPNGPVAAQQKTLREGLEQKARSGGQRANGLFELLLPSQRFEVAHQKTDVFRERVVRDAGIAAALAEGRKQGADTLFAVEQGMGELDRAECGNVVDLMLSYRAISAWDRMIAVISHMAPPLAASLLVREQLAFAHNRLGHREQAAQILQSAIDVYGPSPETCGLLGRVYKDAWQDASAGGHAVRAKEFLAWAIATYLQGFQSDWRDPYPGINAVTLMEFTNPPDERRLELTPVVRYAVVHKMTHTTPDYWDYATLLELAVVAGDERAGEIALSGALSLVRENWEPETTARNLTLIRDARLESGQSTPWIDAILRRLIRE